jgi:TolB-like protein
MANVRHVLLCFSLITLLCGCASIPIQQQGNYQPQPSIATTQDQRQTGETGANPANQSLNLDSAIRNGADYITGISPLKAKMAVLNVQAQTAMLSDYITDHIVMYLINENKFIVVERSDLGLLQKEQEYQASGEVSDQSAVSIGHQLGVQIIITGTLAQAGDLYVLRLKALDVETAEVLGMRIFQIQPDSTLLMLSAPPAAKTEEKKEAAPQQIINGDINITNNNTTTINGDVYVNKPDWFDPDSLFK